MRRPRTLHLVLVGILTATSISRNALATPQVETGLTSPTGLRAHCDDSQVQLSWNPGPAVATYDVTRSEGTGPFKSIAQGITGFSFVDGEVTNGAIYHYMVTAFSPDKLIREDSFLTSARPGKSLLPPEEVKATGLFGMICLAWNAVPGVSHYEIRRLEPADGKYHLIASPQINCFNDDDEWILDEVNYSYRVSCVSTDGRRSALSPIVSAEKFSKIEDVPSGLTASVASGQVKLDWDDWPDAQDSHTNFGVKRSPSATGPFETIASGLSDSSYTDTSATPGTTYYYAVYAQDFGGIGHDSDKVSVAF